MFKRSFVIGLAVILIVLAAGSDVFLRQHYVVPILMYHSVNPVANPYIRKLIVHPDDFKRQMRFLKTHRYNVVSLSQLAELIRQRKKISPRSVAITFDDGYRDNYSYAFEVLKSYGFPATIFLIVNEVGRPSTENKGDDRLSWEEVRQMQASGLITFGSHGLGPEPLVNLKSEEELKREIFVSRQALREKLGVEVRVFSYPEGRFNPRIRQLVREAGYSFAVATSPGRNYPADDIFALKRVRVSAKSRNLLLFWLQASGYYIYFKERRS